MTSVCSVIYTEQLGGALTVSERVPVIYDFSQSSCKNKMSFYPAIFRGNGMGLWIPNKGQLFRGLKLEVRKSQVTVCSEGWIEFTRIQRERRKECSQISGTEREREASCWAYEQRAGYFWSWGRSAGQRAKALMLQDGVAPAKDCSWVGWSVEQFLDRQAPRWCHWAWLDSALSVARLPWVQHRRHWMLPWHLDDLEAY